ncbi:MAG TPA: DUF72 domain-containing protein [Pyrinomonadaceae bacterium]|nr:DUF72 domain-containing protein [Pyrinomonadaceae bacterium]
MTLYVGTSGYSYKEWKGSFYPEKIPAKDMLAYYASRLHAVELNNTFYRMPQPGMIDNWKSQVPENFRFSVKAPQVITHFRRLKDAAPQTRIMLKTISALEDRLGAVIFRLPEDMKRDLKRLEMFLKVLPEYTPAVFDFRHPTWFDDEVVELLRSQKRVFCISDIEELPASYTYRTADWGYVRLRRERYTEAELIQWIKRIKAQKWKNTYVFFKHEDEGTGPKLAEQFVRLSK